MVWLLFVYERRIHTHRTELNRTEPNEKQIKNQMTAAFNLSGQMDSHKQFAPLQFGGSISYSSSSLFHHFLRVECIFFRLRLHEM